MIFKDLVKGLAVVGSIGSAGLIHGEIKVGESNSTRTNFTWVSRKKSLGSDQKLTGWRGAVMNILQILSATISHCISSFLI